MASTFLYITGCVAMLILGAAFGFKIYKRGFSAGIAAATAVRVDDDLELVIPLEIPCKELGIELKE